MCKNDGSNSTQTGKKLEHKRTVQLEIVYSISIYGVFDTEKKKHWKIIIEK